MRESAPSTMFSKKLASSRLRHGWGQGLTGNWTVLKKLAPSVVADALKIWPAGIHMDKRYPGHFYSLLQGQCRWIFSALNIKPFIWRQTFLAGAELCRGTAVTPRHTAWLSAASADLYRKKPGVDTTQFKDVSTVLWQICHDLSSCSFLFPDKPFITVSHKKGPYYEITSGHKSLKLAAKVDAFPRPSVTWWVPSSLAKSGIHNLLLGSCLEQIFAVPHHIDKRWALGMLIAQFS